MGGECLIGNNSDIDLSTEIPNSRKLQYDIQSKYLNYHQKSFQNIRQPIHYNTQYQNQIQNSYRNSPTYYNNYRIHKSINSHRSRSNSLKLINKGKLKNIHNFTREELNDQINDILRIRIPFFDNSILKTISTFTLISGNGPYHEGLMFFTTNKNFYIAQSYPITFIRVSDYFKGITEIISFNNLNKESKKYSISEIYCPQEPITLYDVLNIIKKMPNKYNILNENCQDFCNNVLLTLNKNFKIEKDDRKNNTKINFLKKQRKTKEYKIPFFKPIYNSGRFDNV